MLQEMVKGALGYSSKTEDVSNVTETNMPIDKDNACITIVVGYLVQKKCVEVNYGYSTWVCTEIQ